MDIKDFFPKEHVFILESTEKLYVINEMVNRLVVLKKLEQAERYYIQIIHREAISNTGIGEGLAVPHARTDMVKDYIAGFGVSRVGIDYQSDDKVPVKFFLLSIFPMEMSTKHLYLLGIIAKIISNDKSREELEKAGTPAKVYSILGNGFKNHFANTSKEELAVKVDNKNKILPSYNLDLLIRLDRLYQLYEKGKRSSGLENKINNIKKLIDNRHLVYYERMRKKGRDPFAVLDRGSCAGCNMALAPSYLADVKEAVDIPICNHCGRMLIII